MSQGTITALEVQKRNKQRVNVYLDDEYAFSLSLDEAAKLRKGQVLTEQEVEALRGDDGIQRAVDSAARFLGVRPRSEHEVRRNLAGKDVPDPVIEIAVERLRELGYLDDLAFARYWVESRDTFKPLSKQALRFELREKGVPDTIIGEVLATVDVEDSAFRAAQAQARKLRVSERRAFQDKLSSGLLRRGFDYGTTRRAVQRVIELMETENPDFFTSASDSESWADES